MNAARALQVDPVAPRRGPLVPFGPTRPQSTRQKRRRGSVALEAEADRIADAVAAGHDGSHRITPTVAADVALPRSAGRPLEAGLRQRLEEALDADLSLLRIHTDTAARASVESEGAHAFAAGRDLYFGSDAFRPDTHDGFRRLVHETTHALQQTGRRNSDGQLAVTDAVGSGPIQAEDAFLQLLSGKTAEEKFDHLTTVHLGDGPASAIEQRVELLRTTLGGRIVPGSSEVAALVLAVDAGLYSNGTAQEQSYLLDVLKAAEAWPSAAKILDASSTGLSTLSYSTTFGDWLSERRSGAWRRRRADRHPGLRELRNRIIGAFEVFLARPDGQPYAVIAAEAPRAMANPDGNHDLWPDERSILALSILAEFDRVRLETSLDIYRHDRRRAAARDRAPGSLVSSPFIALGRAQSFVGFLDSAVEFVDLSDGSLTSQLVERCITIRDDAEEFWQRAVRRWVRELEARNRVGRSDIDDERRAALVQQLPQDSVARTQLTRTATAAIVFLDAADTDVPGTAAYLRRIARFSRAIRSAVAAISLDVGRAGFGADDRPRAEVDVWAIWRLEFLLAALDRYRAPQSDEERHTESFDDTRQGHRLHVADELRRLAVEIEAIDLEAATEDIFTNKAGNRTRLILISNWAKPARTDVGDLVEDFPQGIRFTDGLSVSSHAIRDFYIEARLRAVGDRLDHLLQPGRDIEAKDRLIVQDAGRTASALQAPTRHFVERGDWQPNDNETHTIAQLIEEHPKTADQLPIGESDLVVAFPRPDLTAIPINLPHPVFAWALPDLGRLLTEITEALSALDGVTEAIGVVGDDPVDWLTRFATHPDISGTIDTAEVRTAIGTHMRARMMQQRRRLGLDEMPHGLMRRGVNHDRHVVSGIVGTHLRDYALNARVENYDLPNKALDLLHDFYRHALPGRDRVAQLAALVIDLAPRLRAAFLRSGWFGSEVTERRFDIITGYHGLILLAQRWLDDETNLVLLRSEFLDATTISTLDARREQLADVMESFEAVRRQVQTGSGFESTAAGAFRSLNYVQLIEPGNPFGVGGMYELERVWKRFVFHPGYGTRGVTIGGVEMGAPSSPMVIDVEASRGGNLVEVAPDVKLFTLRINENPIDYYARDLDRLDDLWRIIEDQAFSLSMQSLGRLIEEMATLPLDLAEFIPVFGQALAAGRVAFSISMFLASGEFDDVKAALNGDVIAGARDLMQAMGDMLEPEQLWMFLLFGGDSNLLDRLRQRGRGNEDRRRRVSRRRGKMARLLKSVGRLGIMFGRQVEAMRERIQPPLRATQSFANTHPIVAFALVTSAQAIEVGPDIVDRVTSLDGAEEQFTARIESMLVTIEEFELPDEILPLDLMVSAVISLVLDRLGKKGRVAERLLEATGLIDEVSEEVAEVLQSGGADPNVVWREEMQPFVDKILDDARRDLISGIFDALDMIGLDGIERPPERDVQAVRGTTGPEVEAADDAAPAMSPGHDLESIDESTISTIAGDIIPPGSGSPLPRDLLDELESEFPRPLGHVRLHRHDVAPGIDGIARGTHIVVRGGLSLDSGRGRRVLRHELVHVLQQVPDATAPMRGRAGSTIRHDPIAEAQADRIADGAPVPEHLHEVDDDAVAPALDPAFVSSVLRRVASYEDLRAFQDDIQGNRSLPALQNDQPRAVTRAHAALMNALKARPSGRPPIRVSGVPTRTRGTADVEELVRAHARERAATFFGAASAGPTATFTRLARQALRDVTPKQKKNDTTVQAQVFELVPDRFAALIEGYMLVRGGVLLDVDFIDSPENFLNARAAERGFDAAITGLFLGGITRASGLWGLILDTQLKAGTTLRGEGRKSYTITRENQNRVFQAVVARVRAFGPRERSLAAGPRARFEIIQEVIERAVDLLTAQVQLDPEDLPSPTVYANSRTGRDTDVGIRVKNHKTFTQAPVDERDSHHTTQYLLAEYFTNETSPQPFQNPEPGLEFRNGRPYAMHRATGSNPFRFGELEPDRGGLMPAIRIARTTHQRSGLHIQRGAPDEVTDAPTTQAGRMQSWYSARVSTQPSADLPDSRDASAARDSITQDAASRARNAEIVDGIEGVYRSMNTHMFAALRTGLLGEERTYYDTIAGQDANKINEAGDLKPEWRLSDTQLLRVHDHAEEHNRSTMSTYGFGRGS